MDDTAESFLVSVGKLEKDGMPPSEAVELVRLLMIEGNTKLSDKESVRLAELIRIRIALVSKKTNLP